MKKIVCLLLAFLMIFSLASCGLFDRGEPDTGGPGEDLGDEPEEKIVGSENVINVYLIAGQSNAVGYGMDTGGQVASSDERFTSGFENVLYFGNQERWNGKDLSRGFDPVTLGMGVASNRSGAEIGIASAIADEGGMNAIIKCAWGATHLYPDTLYSISKEQGTWTSPSYIAKHNIDTERNPMVGNMYNRFVDTVKEGLKLLIEDGYTPVIKGVWWMQGEAEMFTREMASAYKELYETLISDTRAMLSEVTGYDCSVVPFICGLPKWNTNNSPAPAFQTFVRNSMTSVADQVDNVGYVDCMPLTQHDDWHFDAQGQKYLGENFVSLIKDFEFAGDTGIAEKVSMDGDIGILSAERGMSFRANLTSYNSDNKYEYGFVVIPTERLLKSGVRSMFIDEFDRLGIEYRQIKAKVTVEKIDENYSDIYFDGKLTGITYKDLNTRFTAIAYVKSPVGDYVYSAGRAESLARLASEELYSGGEMSDDLQKLVNLGLNSAAGLPESSSGSNPNFSLISDDSIALSYSEAESVYKLNVTKSIDVDYFVKYTSADPKIVTVDDKGVLEVVGIGETYVLVECAGISRRINVSVENLSVDGISFDGVISDGEYVGEVITAANANLSAKISGMIKNGNLYMAFELDHGAWSSLNNDWWMNDNVEFKLNGGTSHTVVFYEGVPTYSSNITHGVSRTVEKNGRLITTIELCVEGIDGIRQLKVGMNGENFSWLGALWTGDDNMAFISEEGILVGKPLNVGGGILLDGKLDDAVYTETVKNNSITATANGAAVDIIGTLTDGGVLYGVTVDHKLAPEISTDGSNRWWTYMGIEFHFNGTDKQFMAMANNHTSVGDILAYCSTVKTDSGYTTVFEIFIPYESIGVASTVDSLKFTASGWFENGWCWMLNSSWDPSHTITKDGLSKN